MPRKKQLVQKKRRTRVYREGEMSGEAARLKPRGAFRIFTNYRVFAIIGGTALVIGVMASALFAASGGGSDDSTTVRGPGVVRTTPEAGSTSTTGADPTIKQYTAPPALTIDTAKSYVATIETGRGTIKIELLDDEAPQTVNNFVFLAREGFYDGVTFHRVIQDFVAQAGDPTGTGSGGPGYDLPVEQTAVDFEPGIVAMAKPQEAGAPNNGSQFFILLADEPSLAGKATAFGRVIEGMDVLTALTPRDPSSQEAPEPGDRIDSVTIDES
ncbi:MAG: peptidylprolyl isomerase [Dehalococcoidia bacterium]